MTTDEIKALLDGVTKGPWGARGKYAMAVGNCIAITDTDNASEARMEANARLIAAAPDLAALALRQAEEIERLRRALRRLSGEVESVTKAFEPEMRDAIGNTNFGCLTHFMDEARAALEPRT